MANSLHNFKQTPKVFRTIPLLIFMIMIISIEMKYSCAVYLFFFCRDTNRINAKCIAKRRDLSKYTITRVQMSYYVDMTSNLHLSVWQQGKQIKATTPVLLRLRMPKILIKQSNLTWHKTKRNLQRHKHLHHFTMITLQAAFLGDANATCSIQCHSCGT